VDDAFLRLVPALREHSAALNTLIYCGKGPVPEGMLGLEALLAMPRRFPTRAGTVMIWRRDVHRRHDGAAKG